MREIKFRAWLKKEMQMGYPSHLKVGHPEGVFEITVPFEESLRTFRKLHSIDQFDLMQFTGLHDKNGKEIFEGDILRVKWSIKNESPDSEWKAEEHIAGVEWSHPGWKIRWSYFSKPFEIDGNKELCWYDDYHRSNQPGAFHKLTEFEVLGNIYENPELLGGQKDAS